MKVLLIDNYDSFTYNIVGLLQQIKHIKVDIIQNDALSALKVDPYDRIILSPGPNIPSASGDLMAFINEYHQQKHFLGVCLGHQALAEYFGATLKNFTTPFHGEKTIVTQQSASKIWNNLPASFEVGLYHSWYVSEDNLPEEINIVAKSREGIIMALEHEKWPLYGVQFHPESYMSEQGLELIRNFLAE